MCLDEENNVNKRELKLFEKEYRNFLKISNVKQFGGGTEEEARTKVKTK